MRLNALALFHLKEVELDRRRPAENSDHNLQRITVGIHVVNNAVEIGERTVDDPDVLPFFKCQFRLGPIRSSGHLINNLLDFFIAERRRTLPGSDKSRYSRGVFYGMPGFVA